MEKIFLNLKEIAEEKELISDKFCEDKWRASEYKIKHGNGVMLIAPQEAMPRNITLDLNLKGWYRIFVGMLSLRSENYTYIKLSDDLCFTGIRCARNENPCEWAEEEYAEEVYVRSADLTGKKMILGKPDPVYDNISSLVWIRCVEMTDEEVANYKEIESSKNKCVQMHIDEDPHRHDKFECDDDYLIQLFGMKNTNTDFCSLEYAFDYDRPPYYYADETHLCRYERILNEHDYKFNNIKERIYKKYTGYAHSVGIELYAAERMSMTSFSFPYEHRSWHKNFTDEHSEFYCENRDGSITSICSYAYPEVQNYVLRNMKDILKFGFDGITMIFHRGLHLGFEKPVRERFALKYPDLDMRLLPVKDSRLHLVWCEIMNEFMARARKELGEKVKINVISDYGPETAKHFGLDLANWAERGYVNSISQGDMETYEDLTECMSDKNDGLIDLEKYKKRILDYPVIRRNYANNLKKVLDNIEFFSELEKKTGVKVYFVLPWENTLTEKEYLNYVKALEEKGAKRFLAWNAYSSMWNLPEWYNITHIGNKKEDFERRRFVRMLQIGGYDISNFNNNWRG